MNHSSQPNMSEDKRALLLLASSRRRARGVAMVEGALIFPIMAFFLVYLELAHHSFDAYLSAEHISEQRTWSSATVGAFAKCGAGRNDTNYQPVYMQIQPSGGTGDTSVGSSPSTAGGTGAGGQYGSGAAGKTSGQGGPSGWFIHQDGAAVQVTVKRGSVSYDGTAHRPSAKSEVFCNQPWYGSIIDIIKNAI